MRTERQQERRKAHRRPPTTFREFLLIFLIAVAGGLSIYVSQDQHTAFGLLEKKDRADVFPVITAFRTTPLTSREFLALNISPDILTEKASSLPVQIEAELLDPSVPPPVQEFAALNTRVGGEVALFWEKPEQVPYVQVYRREFSDTNSHPGTLLSTADDEQVFVDETVKNGSTYVYTAVSAVDFSQQLPATTADSAALWPTAIVQVSDDIPPSAPFPVVVQTAVDDEQQPTGLRVTWENPSDPDFRSIEVYRSSVYGQQGILLARIVKESQGGYTLIEFYANGDVAQTESVSSEHAQYYEDTSAQPNSTYYYTVIAVDIAGNKSSKDFSIPPAGNPSPFSPFVE